MVFYSHTYKVDKIKQPKLFRLNGIRIEEKLVNLTILFNEKKY